MNVYTRASTDVRLRRTAYSLKLTPPTIFMGREDDCPIGGYWSTVDSLYIYTVHMSPARKGIRLGEQLTNQDMKTVIKLIAT